MGRFRLLACACLLAIARADEPAVLRLVLDESFEGSSLNPAVWNIETGRRKDALNTADAVDVAGGRLVITTWTDTAGTTHCGFVTTRGKLLIQTGKAVARCRYRVLPGTQVAFWLQSPTYAASGKAEGAAKDGVEIDVMETTGLMEGGYQYALHWGPYGSPTEKHMSNRRFPAKVGQDWHDYGVEWDERGYRFTLDGAVVATDTRCPASRAPEFLLVTSESTIRSWNGERPAAGYGAKAASTNRLEVEWVKAWTRGGTPARR